MIETTFADIVENGLPSSFALQHRDAYRVRLEYLAYQHPNYHPDCPILFEKGIPIVDGAVVSMFSEEINIDNFISSPCMEVSIGEDNSAFMPVSLDDPRVLLTNHPYSQHTQGDYVESISNKKKRWKFRKNIKEEKGVTIHKSSLDSLSWKHIYASRSFALNPEDEYTHEYEILRNLDTPPIVFVARKKNRTIGVAILIEVKGYTWTPQTVYLCHVFYSVEPCLYHMHKEIMENYLPKNSILHYGNSFSFYPDISKVYKYKSQIANSSLSAPYFAIQRGAQDLYPPYFDLDTNRWHTTK